MPAAFPGIMDNIKQEKWDKKYWRGGVLASSLERINLKTKQWICTWHQSKVTNDCSDEKPGMWSQFFCFVLTGGREKKKKWSCPPLNLPPFTSFRSRPTGCCRMVTSATLGCCPTIPSWNCRTTTGKRSVQRRRSAASSSCAWAACGFASACRSRVAPASTDGRSN